MRFRLAGGNAEAHGRKGGGFMANRDIKKEKKKPKAGAKQSDAVLKAPVPQPELVKKERKEK